MVGNAPGSWKLVDGFILIKGDALDFSHIAWCKTFSTLQHGFVQTVTVEQGLFCWHVTIVYIKLPDIWQHVLDQFTSVEPPLYWQPPVVTLVLLWNCVSGLLIDRRTSPKVTKAMAVCCLAIAHSPLQITIGLESKVPALNLRVKNAQHNPTVQMAAVLKSQVVFSLELCSVHAI